jgi:hypothetical protein
MYLSPLHLPTLFKAPAILAVENVVEVEWNHSQELQYENLRN